MSTASRLAKLAEGLDSNGVLSADKGGTGATSLAAVVTSATPAGVSDQVNTSTGYFDLPVGTTTQRPASANTGMVRYNSTLSIVETYNGTSWTGLGGGAATVSATAPASPTEGAFWLKDDTGDLHVYAGGAWILAGGGGSSFSGSYTDLTNKPTLATVATTGSYADLINTPTITAAAVSDQANTSTGYFDLPVGTTAQRPSTGTAGALRLNTETNYLEMYSGTAWINLQYVGLMTATSSGATVTTSGNYKTLTYTSTGSFTLTDAPIGSTVEVLLISGGGGGGNAYGGGGGAGGYYYNASMSIPTGSYAVTIGAGGTNSSVAALPGTNGSNTSFNSQTALGGGGGGEYNSSIVVKAGDGGSGGGSGGTGTLTGSKGTGSQGNNGGVGVGSGVATAFGGGGGGAGAVGSAAVGTAAGSGGAGIINPITGSTLGQFVSPNYYIAGGGGGGGYTGGTVGSGGSGGGGAGTLAATNGLLPVSMNFSTWNYNSASQANTNSIAPDGSATATLMNVTAGSWDMYYNRTGLNSSLTYIFTVWVKLGTATNFAVAFNNTAAWDSVAGNKTYTSADGLNTSTWTKISHSVTGQTGMNMHICGHANGGHPQQTAGTLYMWGPTLTTGSQTQATSGTAYTGGGGGGSGDWSTSYGGNGGSGAAIIKYRYQ